MIDALTFIAAFCLIGLAVAVPLAMLGDHVMSALANEAQVSGHQNQTPPPAITGIRG